MNVSMGWDLFCNVLVISKLFGSSLEDKGLGTLIHTVNRVETYVSKALKITKE